MITTTQGFNALYDSDDSNSLFRKAEQRLINIGLSGWTTEELAAGNVGIRSIEEYFQYLAYLVNGPSPFDNPLNDEEGLLFLYLPLQEERFEIDANTRNITIPNHFLEHGLTVQGDQIAEIVFFEIDRFYDATDLFQVDNIVIEWEAKDAKGNLVQGYTPAFIKDVTLLDDTNKLLFGWPVTRELSVNSGSIRFAVRFYTKNPDDLDNEEYDYSFSTLPATIGINKGLNLELSKLEPDNAYPIITRRIRNSPSPTDKDYGEANIPTIIWLSPLTYSNDLYPEKKILEFEAITEETKLCVLADPGQGGRLSYAWYRELNEADTKPEKESDNYEELRNFAALSEEGAYDYIPVDSYQEKVSIYYYINPSTGKYVQKSITTEEAFNELINIYKTIYVKASCWTLTPATVKAGIYKVDVCNEFYNKEAFASTNGWTKLPKWRVKGPETINFITDLSDWNKVENVLTVAIDSMSDETTLEWWHADVYVEEGVAIENSNSLTYQPVSEGYYFVKASNTRNNSTITEVSNKCLVLSDIADFEVEIQQGVDNSNELTAKINRDLQGKYESIKSITWYYNRSLNPADRQAFSSNISTVDVTEYLIEGPCEFTVEYILQKSDSRSQTPYLESEIKSAVIRLGIDTETVE